MRVLIALLLSVLLASPASPSYMVICGADGGCSAPAGDILTEGFDLTGGPPCYNEVGEWTETGSVTIDECATLPGSPPAGSCTQGLKIDVAYSGGAKNGWTMWDYGSTVTGDNNDVDIEYSIYIDSSTYLAAYVWNDSFNWSSAANPYTTTNEWKLYTRSPNTPDRWRVTTNATSVYNAGGVLSTDTWHVITVHLDYRETAVCGGGSEECSYIEVDGGDTLRFKRSADDGRYLYIGSNAAQSPTDILYYIGYVKIDVTAKP
jgi:hypothetical protein